MAEHDCSWLLGQLRAEGISDPRVLGAIRRVPREHFVPANLASRAYENEALPVDQGQTISQPYVVACMTQALALTGTERVLEIGTGTGYQTAILANLAAEVVSVERIAALADAARRRLTSLGVRNVQLLVGDGSLGAPSGAPYDAIVVTAGGPRVPARLAAQLAISPPGRLIMPVGPRDEQQLLLLSGDPHSRALRRLGPVRFVPLIGNEGWEVSS
ncbi:MAG TPA: protein-L-isoaspartate(D-aspartate) O-methyltransferase [Chloroflexota bacterium]|nr:protein-L-isoaspartate(D-aspartate) O-methyltransferase [Chloroflexota bacterium]